MNQWDAHVYFLLINKQFLERQFLAEVDVYTQRTDAIKTKIERIMIIRSPSLSSSLDRHHYHHHLSRRNLLLISVILFKYFVGKDYFRNYKINL